MTITDGTIEAIVTKSIGILPGTITAFSGEFNQEGFPIDRYTGKADTEWHLCDGTHGTPDLTGQFIMGASDTPPAGDRGGERRT